MPRTWVQGKDKHLGPRAKELDPRPRTWVFPVPRTWIQGQGQRSQCQGLGSQGQGQTLGSKGQGIGSKAKDLGSKAKDSKEVCLTFSHVGGLSTHS